MKEKKISNSNLVSENLSLLKKILSPLEFRRDLLIEHLHKIQDYFGYLSEDNLILLSKLNKMSEVEVYEVASFYAHFDIVKKDDPKPPKLTLRVCSSLSCELFGSKLLEEELVKKYMHEDIRVLKAPCMGRCNKAPVVEVGHYHFFAVLNPAPPNPLKSAFIILSYQFSLLFFILKSLVYPPLFL